VARLIKGGLKTPIYIVNHPNSFDTHSNQVSATDTTVGTHANLLGILSKALNAFQQDITMMGIQDRVTGMTFTEFGRRIKSNASVGTDHGTSIPMFFFGAKLNPAITGASPVLPANPTVNDQIPMQYDFRAVYYTVLKDWFQLSDTDLAAVLTTPFATLPIFNQAALPVSITSFTGIWSSKVTLQWTTDQEINVDRYEVERSSNGANFEKIGSVNSTRSGIKQSYSYDDINLTEPMYYYRLKIVEVTGAFIYSSVILLKANQQAPAIRIRVSPNPVQQWFNISFDTKISGAVIVRMVDMYGREAWKEQVQAADTYNLNFSLRNRSFAKGIYVIQVQTASEEGVVKVLVDQ
jgi:hypothetical protein